MSVCGCESRRNCTWPWVCHFYLGQCSFYRWEVEVWRDSRGSLTKGYPRQSENYDPFFCLMSKCSFNPLFVFSGLTRNHSLFSVSRGDKHLKSPDISIDFASTGLLTFTCGYLFIVQTSLWACLWVLGGRISILSLDFCPQFLSTHYVLSMECLI